MTCQENRQQRSSGNDSAGLTMVEYLASCLCGHIKLKISGNPKFPHLCSCSMCRRTSGAPTVAWADFEGSALEWRGLGRPKYFQSSERTRRGFCPECGCLICAVDNDCTTISLTLGCFDDPGLIVPGKTHSFKSDAPNWWHVSVG
jgi:hypothetical protein